MKEQNNVHSGHRQRLKNRFLENGIKRFEDHNIIGGLGSAISEVLTENYPCKLERMGIND